MISNLWNTFDIQNSLKLLPGLANFCPIHLKTKSLLKRAKHSLTTTMLRNLKTRCWSIKLRTCFDNFSSQMLPLKILSNLGNGLPKTLWQIFTNGEKRLDRRKSDRRKFKSNSQSRNKCLISFQRRPDNMRKRLFLPWWLPKTETWRKEDQWQV